VHADSRQKQLRGIGNVRSGDATLNVVVRVGDNLFERAITRRNADELKLKKGDTVLVLAKAKR